MTDKLNAGTEIRTRTLVRGRDPQSRASTSSAIPAGFPQEGP